MRIHPVQIDVPLSEDGLVDILLVQWRTPIPDEEGVAPTVLSESAALKERVLDSLCSWIHREQRQVNRALLVLTPEVSTPLSFLEKFERLLASLDRPTVVVVGIDYLDPSEYRNLISRSLNPEKDFWTQDVDASQKVNVAVILTRGADGTLGIYVQPKIRPADPERRWRVYGAQHVLLFHHKSHAPGAGLHFCVQICSDFCNQTHVSTLREKIAEQFKDEDLRLDLTLLLQCNRQQEMPQFRDGTNAYFGAPHQMRVRTEAGALLMLNNASRLRRRSAHWGNSQFRFLYDTWKQPGGEFTYWLSQGTGEKWQAATFRDSGPSVYWVTYKPLYLCDRRPSEDTQPFIDVSCWPITTNDCVPSFKPISGVMHWLEAEWTSGGDALANWLTEQGIDEQVARELLKAYSESAIEWVAALNHDITEGALRTLFVCFKKQGYPYGKENYEGIEPMSWCKNPYAGKAATEMLRLHALLRIGASGSGAEFRAAPLGARHALLVNSIPITYLWGGGEMMSKHMAEQYRNHLLPLPVRTSAQHVVIVLMNPKDRTESDELVQHLYGGQIDRASPPPGGGTHLSGAGEVVTGERWQPIFLHDHLLQNGLNEGNVGAAKSRLSQVVQGVMEREA